MTEQTKTPSDEPRERLCWYTGLQLENQRGRLRNSGNSGSREHLIARTSKLKRVLSHRQWQRNVVPAASFINNALNTIPASHKWQIMERLRLLLQGTTDHRLTQPIPYSREIRKLIDRVLKEEVRNHFSTFREDRAAAIEAIRAAERNFVQLRFSTGITPEIAAAIDADWSYEKALSDSFGGHVGYKPGHGRDPINLRMSGPVHRWYVETNDDGTIDLIQHGADGSVIHLELTRDHATLVGTGLLEAVAELNRD